LLLPLVGLSDFTCSALIPAITVTCCYQIYALDDPTGYAYGNANFSYVEDYLVYEAKQHKRAVSFYGETAYW
jgi:hypothetical protein